MVLWLLPGTIVESRRTVSSFFVALCLGVRPVLRFFAFPIRVDSRSFAVEGFFGSSASAKAGHHSCCGRPWHSPSPLPPPEAGKPLSRPPRAGKLRECYATHVPCPCGRLPWWTGIADRREILTRGLPASPRLRRTRKPTLHSTPGRAGGRGDWTLRAHGAGQSWKSRAS